MRKRLALVLALAASMVGTLAVPAHAQREGLIHCTGDIPTGQCWNVRGIAADVRVANWTLGCPGGHVDSLYLSQSQFDPNPSVEFGWVQDRYSVFPGICSYTNREMFIVAYDNNGNIFQETTFSINSYGTGGFRLLMYQNSSSPGIVRFAFDDPGRVRHFLNTTVNMSAIPGFGGATAAKALTSMEIINEETDTVAQSAWPYHRNVWVLNGNYVWKPANEVNGDEMSCADDQLTKWRAIRTANTGTTGDHITYSRTSGVTC